MRNNKKNGKKKPRPVALIFGTSTKCRAKHSSHTINKEGEATRKHWNAKTAATNQERWRSLKSRPTRRRWEEAQWLEHAMNLDLNFAQKASPLDASGRLGGGQWRWVLEEDLQCILPRRRRRRPTTITTPPPPPFFFFLLFYTKTTTPRHQHQDDDCKVQTIAVLSLLLRKNVRGSVVVRLGSIGVLGWLDLGFCLFFSNDATLHE